MLQHARQAFYYRRPSIHLSYHSQVSHIAARGMHHAVIDNQKLGHVRRSTCSWEDVVHFDVSVCSRNCAFCGRELSVFSSIKQGCWVFLITLRIVICVYSSFFLSFLFLFSYLTFLLIIPLLCCIYFFPFIIISLSSFISYLFIFLVSLLTLALSFNVYFPVFYTAFSFWIIFFLFCLLSILFLFS